MTWPWAALPWMGESLHNNHHAFPAWACHGLYPGRIDLGFRFIRWLERVGLGWNIQTPEKFPPRGRITAVAEEATRAEREAERRKAAAARTQ